MKLFAVIFIKGVVRADRRVKRTLALLNLKRKNQCALVHSKNAGMIKKIKDRVTWGEVKKETILKLFKKRGKQLKGKRKLTAEFLKEKKLGFEELAKQVFEGKLGPKELRGLGIKPIFSLKPPTKGFERKGVKKTYSIGGALGYRGEKINSLLERMI